MLSILGFHTGIAPLKKGNKKKKEKNPNSERENAHTFHFISVVCVFGREGREVQSCIGSKITLEAFAHNVVSASPTPSNPGVLFWLSVSLATLQLAGGLEAFLPSSFSTDRRFSRGNF